MVGHVAIQGRAYDGQRLKLEKGDCMSEKVDKIDEDDVAGTEKVDFNLDLNTFIPLFIFITNLYIMIIIL